MGLDFSHGGAHWSYRGFNRFRRALSKAAAMGNLEEREGFGGTKPWPASPQTCPQFLVGDRTPNF